MSRTYHEPGCGYRSLWGAAVVLAAAFALDAALGAARAHWVGWLVAAVLVLGANLIVVRATRQFKTLDVTDAEIRIGEEAVPREAVVSAAPSQDDGSPALGWTGGAPRRRPLVALALADGRRVLVPTRRPAAVLAALGAATPAGSADVRPATPADLPLLAEIDERADAVFRVAGYDLPALEFPDPADAAAVFVAGEPVCGFARVDVLDGEAHLSALAVLPGAMRRGVGSALLDAACGWARGAGYRAVTLTTYADVPWNAPMYARRGWEPFAEPGPHVRELRAEEVAAGLDDVGPRVVLRREL